MKTYTLDEVTDKLIGRIGTSNRDKFESDLEMDLKTQSKSNCNLKKNRSFTVLLKTKNCD